MQISPAERQFYKTHLELRDTIGHSFVNRTPLLSVGPRTFSIPDAVAAAVQSKTNMYLVGTRGTGKTLLAETLRDAIFGGKGFYIRGDVNLQLKDLYSRFVRNKQDGASVTVQEVDPAALALAFMLIDELSRVPGILQNQFLNMTDGYVELRGVKYPFGGRRNYSLAVATANPLDIGGEDTGVFEVNSALLDRFPLIIDTDEVPFAPGDIYSIMGSAGKGAREPADLSESVIDSYEYLSQLVGGAGEHRIGYSLLGEYLYARFRYLEVNDGGSTRKVDKIAEPSWRDKLAGQHAAGSVISYCAEVSPRILKDIQKFAMALLQIIDVEHKLQNPDSTDQTKVSEFIDTYVAALKLALTYDPRFLPHEIPERIGKSHAHMHAQIFSELRQDIQNDQFAMAILLLQTFDQAQTSGQRSKIYADATGISDPRLRESVHGIMNMKMADLAQEGIFRRRLQLLNGG